MDSQPSPVQPEVIPTAPGPASEKGRRVMVVLAACMALQMTGFVMIAPLYARRFEQFGGGVKALSASAMAFALAAAIAAPFMGALADRFGRRRLALFGLLAYCLAFTGYLFAFSAPAFIILRGLAGAFTAGLVPAVLGIVADFAPKERRAQWIGIVNGGASIGWMAGPLLGGFFYDSWGYSVALLAAIGMALAAFIMAVLTLPPDQPRLHSADRSAGTKTSLQGLWQSFPRPLSTFLLVLGVFFVVLFTYAFIEPKMMFYAYDELGWSSSMLGLAMSAYGISLTLGEFTLSRLSDRWGRRPVILLGLLLFTFQYSGLAFFHNFLMVSAAFFIAGLGNALYDPALTASLLDITRPEHQARVLGIKSAAGSFGSILGPALVGLLSGVLEARGIFLVSLGIVVLAILFFIPGLRLRSKPAAA